MVLPPTSASKPLFRAAMQWLRQLNDAPPPYFPTNLRISKRNAVKWYYQQGYRFRINQYASIFE
ncbi:hypothetical protein RvY_18832 [Ramazzottius varieornatus]|uniref:Uncharacterized protein n=1 Tax=Ramazzottius varieornatus TaxID=947166 RepID=A0A1D1W791_RAMVA|nr:hypothetical protein RvY_18832 [Ramazzottius varieornatus]